MLVARLQVVSQIRITHSPGRLAVRLVPRTHCQRQAAWRSKRVCAMLDSAGPMEPYARSVELVRTNWKMFARVVRHIRTLQHKAHPVCAMPGSWQEMQDNVYQQRVQRMNISAIHWYDVKTALLCRLRRRIVLLQALVCATPDTLEQTEQLAQFVMEAHIKWVRTPELVTGVPLSRLLQLVAQIVSATPDTPARTGVCARPARWANTKKRPCELCGRQVL